MIKENLFDFYWILRSFFLIKGQLVCDQENEYHECAHKCQQSEWRGDPKLEHEIINLN